jgi:GNAT superfamily N-acetyltransferase
MTLTPALPTDLEAVAALVNGAYRGQGGWTHEADYIDGARVTPELLRRDLEAEPGALLTLRDGEGLSGCVWLEAKSTAVWSLGMLSVSPARQDQGLGRQILDACEALAREAGVGRMRMTVVNIRDTLIAWYGRRGYLPTGETKPFPYGDDSIGRPNRDDLYFVVLEKAL